MGGDAPAVSEAAHATLGDGRRLAYAEYGDPGGEPVFWFHGAPSSRMEPLLIGDEALRAAGLRVIAPDRPGMGLSDFQRGRRFTDWPRDIVALADALTLPRFGVLGFSGGGPYVAACAAAIPERISRAVVVSGGWDLTWPEAREGVPVPNRIMFTLARRAPWLLALMLKLMLSMAKDGGDAGKELEGLRKRLPPPDFEALRDPRRMQAMNRIIRESLRQGPRGATWDLGLYTRDFGFGPRDVRVPITFFHGGADANVPLALARRLAASLSAATLVVREDEAHMSMLCARFEEIAQALRP